MENTEFTPTAEDWQDFSDWCQNLPLENLWMEQGEDEAEQTTALFDQMAKAIP